MSEGVESQGQVRFAPGTSAPTADERRARMQAGREAWNSLPKSERARRRAAKKSERDEKQAKKDAKVAAKEAERAAKEAARAARRGGGASAAAQPPHSSGPDTVRSSRLVSEPLPRATIASPPPSSAAPFRDPIAIGPVKGLLDLVATMPDLGDGTCFIQVTRVKPVTAFNVPCAGVQAAIWEPVDDAEFQAFYGGAEYTLRGYKLREKDGRPVPITEPVQHKVPGPPNLESAAVPDEEPPMQRHQQPNGSPFARRAPVLTPQQASAEAEIHARDLEHRETMDERDERRRREKEERQRNGEREAQRTTLDRERLLLEAKDREADRLQAAHERQIEAERGRASELAEMFKMMGPRDDGGRAAQAHATEMRLQAESHREETARQTEQHRAEIQRLVEQHGVVQQRLEEQNRQDRERADNLVRETERRSNEQIREAQRAADGRVSDAQNLARSQYEDLRARSEERLRDNETQWQRRLDDRKDSHDRELRQKESEINLMRQNLEGNQKVILDGKDNEIKRLQHELRLSKDEAEKNKDWRGRMKAAAEDAEALGYVKADEAGGDESEGDLKTIAVKAGMQALTRLPEMIQAGANAIASVRNPQGLPDRGGSRPGAVRSQMRTVPRSHGAPAFAPHQPPQLTFATEGGSDYVPPQGSVAPQQAPQPAQYFQPDPPPMTAPQQPLFDPAPMVYTENPGPELPALPQPAAQPTQATPPAAPAAPQQPASVAPQGMVPAPQSVPPPAPAGAVPPMSEQAQMIAGVFVPELAKNFDARVSPEQVAQSIVSENGAPTIRVALTEVSLAQLMAFIQASGGFPNLASRNGQKFLRSVWQNTERLVAETSAQ